MPRHPILILSALSLFAAPLAAQSRAHNVLFAPGSIAFPMPSGQAIGLILQPRALDNLEFVRFKDPVGGQSLDVRLGVHLIATLDERECIETTRLNLGRTGVGPEGDWLQVKQGLALLGPHSLPLRYVAGPPTPHSEEMGPPTPYRLFFSDLSCADGAEVGFPDLVLMVLTIDGI